MDAKTVEWQTLPEPLRELVTEARQGREVILSEAGRPLARLVPLAPPPAARVAGLNLGMIWVADDFDDPLPESFWTGSP